jgi:RecA-family ATPase
MSLSITNIGRALTGDSLIAAMHAAKEARKPLVEGLIYDKTMLLVSADPGTGKSTISTQIMIEAAAGLPIFGMLHVPKPLKFLYAQTERDILEVLERIEVFSKSYPIVKENIFVTDEYQRFNMLNTDHVHMLAECIKRDCPGGVDVINWDPIYSMVSGGLSKDEPAAAFTHAMSIIHKEIGAVHWYNHHTVKPEYFQGKKQEREDPFYGSQWLKAHCTGAYYMKKTEKGVQMIRKKDNYGILTEILDLEYNAETGLCTINMDGLTAKDRIRNYIGLKKMEGKTFYFDDIVNATKVCTRQVRTILLHSSIKDLIIVVSTKDKKHLYAAAP